MSTLERHPIAKFILDMNDSELLLLIRKHRQLRELKSMSSTKKTKKPTVKNIAKRNKIPPEILLKAAQQLLNESEE